MEVMRLTEAPAVNQSWSRRPSWPIWRVVSMAVATEVPLLKRAKSTMKVLGHLDEYAFIDSGVALPSASS